ncbi:unnamed protein product [Schistocephalus solidus]|uniref:RING-type domain-containing protein n=1 Tax=Schistocephalus solidus TaxID=70667 RepID=A0A183SZA7_SCHSO|nr:unnamed protein product [Schistocephalus solidus]
MPDNDASTQQTQAQPSPQPLEVTEHSFRRMPSQRRRRLWMLAARAAAQKEHIPHEREVAPPSGTVKHLAEHRGSSLLTPAKPGTVRTQDSGISSMDYVTSREANSPNSEEAGLVSSATAGSSRARANTTTSLLLYDRRESRLCSEVDPRPRLSLGPAFLSPHSATTGAPNFRTEIAIPKGDREHRYPEYSAHLNTQRYTNLCHNYVPDWVRRNWSSAPPRTLIPRQRSSVETTGIDTSNDWASMEALNIQQSLYPHNWRLYSGRHGGRLSCPKASAFFESSLNEPNTVHLEAAEEEDDDDEEEENCGGGGDADVNEDNCGLEKNTSKSENEPRAAKGDTMLKVNPGGGNPYERMSPQADLENPGGSLMTSIHLRRRRRPGCATAVSTTLPYLEPDDLPQFSRSRDSSYAFLPQRVHTEPDFPLCWCNHAVAVVPCPNPDLTERAYPADFLTLRSPTGTFAYHRPSSHFGTAGLSPLLHCHSCPFRFMPHSECTLNVPYHQHPHHYHPCSACCLECETLPPHNIPYGQSLGHPMPQYDLPQRHVRRRMLKRMASEPLPPTWTNVSPGVSVVDAGATEGSPLGGTAPPRKRATPKPLEPGSASAPSTAISIVQPPLPADHVHTASPPTHIYADTRIIDYRAGGRFSHERTTGGAEVFIRAPDSTTTTTTTAASTDLPSTKRLDVRVHRGLRAGTGLVRGRSADEAYSSQCRSTEPLGGRGEGGTLSYQPYRMAASDFQIARPCQPHRTPAAGWEERQATLLTEKDPTCFHGLMAPQAGEHFYRHRLCPHIYEEEEEGGWKPYEVAVEAAPARVGPFYSTQRIRKYTSTHIHGSSSYLFVSSTVLTL